MKKRLLVCVMALAAMFAVTGCGNKNENSGNDTTTTAAAEKKLQCSVTKDGDTMRFSFAFNGDKISKATFTSTEKLKSEKEAKAQYEKDSKEVSEVNKNKGINASISYSGTLVTSSLSFTIDNMDDAAKAMYDEIFGEIKDKNADEISSTLSATGFTCK